MRYALHAELRKITTTRTWWLLLIGMIFYVALLSILVAFTMTSDASPNPEAALAAYTSAASMGYAFPLAVGTLSVTSEYRYQTLVPTFLADPRRRVTTIAKMISSLALGFIYGISGTLTAVLSALVVLKSRNIPTELNEPETLRTLAASVILLALWCVVGTGLGTLLTNQTLAIVGILTFTQFIEPLLRLVLAGTEIGSAIAHFLPGTAGEAVVGSSFFTASGITDLLAPWQGLLVLLGYGAIFALVGTYRMRRRDFT